MPKIVFKKIFILFFSIYWYILMIIYHAAGITAGILFLLFGLRKLTSSATVVWVRSMFFLGGLKLHIKGLENISSDFKYLFIMNHSSFFDIHAIMSVRPDITWLSKKENFDLPLIGAGLRISGGIPIDRKNFSKSLENVYRTVKNARQGFSLGIFPEGTRSVDGNLQRFKRGFVRILRNSDLQLIPITLNGFYEFKPKNRWTFHPVKNLDLIIHKPVTQDEIGGLSDSELIDKVLQTIRNDYMEK